MIEDRSADVFRSLDFLETFADRSAEALDFCLGAGVKKDNETIDNLNMCNDTIPIYCYCKGDQTEQIELIRQDTSMIPVATFLSQDRRLRI